MKKVEEKRVDVSTAVSMGEVILAACHWITIIRARFEEVGSWAQRKTASVPSPTHPE